MTQQLPPLPPGFEPIGPPQGAPQARQELPPLPPGFEPIEPSQSSGVTIEMVREQARAAGMYLPQGVETMMSPEQLSDAIRVATLPPGEKLRHAGRTAVQAVGDLATGANVAARQMAKGVPFVGQYLDEANAATNAAFAPVIGTGEPGATFSERYSANLAGERGQDRAFETAHPYLSTGLQVGGAVAGTMAGIRAFPGATKIMLGNVGRSLPARMVFGAGAGATLGGVGGFGAGEGGFDERLSRAKTGAGVGALAGAAVPAVAAGVGATADALKRWGVARDLGVPGASVRRVAQNVADDQLTPSVARQRAAELGDDAMLLDVGRQTRLRGEAIAAQPGRGQNTILDAVEDRVKRTAERVGQELDGALGKSPDVVKLAQQIDDTFATVTKPAYDKAMNAHPQVWDNTLGELTRRPSIQRAINNAVELARESGDDIVSPFAKAADGSLSLKPGATPNLQFWDYVKKSLDGRINALARNPDPGSAGKTNLGALLETKNTLLAHLDDLTGGTYKAARDIAADKYAIKNAVDTGLELFQNKMLPEQFRAMVDGMGAVERRAVAAGARRALERMREVAPANISEGGRQIYRELLQGGRNGDTAQKLRMLLGDDAADTLIRGAMRETQFQSAYENVAGNSRTAVRAELGRETADPTISAMTASRIAGLPIRAVAAPVEAGIGSIMRQGAAKTREGIADLLTRRGPELERTVDALTKYNASRTPRDALVRALMAGAGTQAGASEMSMRDRRWRDLLTALMGRAGASGE